MFKLNLCNRLHDYKTRHQLHIEINFKKENLLENCGQSNRKKNGHVYQFMTYISRKS